MKFTGNSEVLVIMSADELGIIRYALDHGVDKLESNAIFLRTLDKKEGGSANRTAKKARDASEALEAAVKEYLLKG